MDKGLLGNIWYLKEKAVFGSCTRIAQFTEAFQILYSWKAGHWTGFTNPDSAKHSHTLSLKEFRSHDKWMATMFWAVAATCDNLKEAEKLTLGEPTMVLVPH